MAARTDEPERAGRARHMPSEAGAWLFILGDMTLFGVIFAVYLNARREDPGLFARSQDELTVAFGAINTVLLLSSSLLVVWAVRALRARRTVPAPRLIAGAIACGLGFVAMKVLEYSDKGSDGITAHSDEFFMYFYVLTGLHLFHVLLGLGLLVFVWVLARRDALDAQQVRYAEGGACFWHMVDLLWIVLFPLLYLVH